MRRALPVALGLAVLAVTGCTLGRPEDPVVLRGSQLPALQDVAAGDVIAFRWVNGWDQVPVQVDERKPVDLDTVYNKPPSGVMTTVYADPGTFTGPDTDPDLDGDDEVVFMAKDVGNEAPPGTAEPPGVVPGSGTQVKVMSSIADSDYTAWVYLFRRSGNLDPGAGESYVGYEFNLLSGDYKSTYRLQFEGSNPEDSTVNTPFYEDHFSDRWLNDALRVKTGSATEVDILDRAKARLVPGNCGRSEDTFNEEGPGAFIANKVGPVRAIRSYIGANSGPRTQREHLFYEQRQDIRTFLRVHEIPGVLDYLDYSSAASGMTYRNNNNPSGVTIDGVPDSPTPGTLTWESVDGPQGGLSMVHTIVTDIPGFAATSYYLDDATPDELQCTGDSQSLGASGPWVNQRVPTTDPIGSLGVRTLRSTRTIYFEAPGAADGAQRLIQATTPFRFVISAFP